ncbi:hypothetical protein GWO13_08760 [Candidatus Bathyarchaeota archaeon]|nr:hypothetical protein [Candidatus Bathyarchaeota archaeon]
MNGILDGARVLLCLFFMIYASWSDFRSREVSNRVWAIFAPSAFALTSSQFFLFAPESLGIYVLSFVVTSALSVTLFYAGAFGGADAKALMCLALALPSYPTHLLQPYSGFVSPLFSITVFCNAVLLAALSVLYVVLRNCLWKHKTGKRLFEGFEEESRWRKILVFLCGYKVDVAQLEKKQHLYPLEDIDDDERKLLPIPKDEDRSEIVGRFQKAGHEGKLGNGVWATPGLPLLVFVTVGLIVGLIYGDIVWVIIRSALGYS